MRFRFSESGHSIFADAADGSHGLHCDTVVSRARSYSFMEKVHGSHRRLVSWLHPRRVDYSQTTPTCRLRGGAAEHDHEIARQPVIEADQQNRQREEQGIRAAAAEA